MIVNKSLKEKEKKKINLKKNRANVEFKFAKCADRCCKLWLKRNCVTSNAKIHKEENFATKKKEIKSFSPKKSIKNWSTKMGLTSGLIYLLAGFLLLNSGV